jgi:hypothetical protein
MGIDSIWIRDIVSRELPLDCKNKSAAFLVNVFDATWDQHRPVTLRIKLHQAVSNVRFGSSEHDSVVS